MPERKLTVVQLVPALEFGGVERGTLEVADALVKRGHRSIVISSGGRLVSPLTDSGSEHITWPIHKKSPLTLRMVPKLRKWFAEVQPDIIHARSRIPAWATYLAWRNLPAEQRPRFVTTVHGFYSVSPYSAIMTRGERVIATSESIRSYALKNYKFSPDSMTVIHRGVAAEDFPYGYQPSDAWQQAWYAQFPMLRDRTVITLPGRLSRWKGHADFIEMIARLRAQGLPVEGVIAGGGPNKRSGHAYVRELAQLINNKAPGHIHLTGHRSDIREVMAVSDIVLSLSSQPEAFGRVAPEALYLGRPTIGYQHGGVSEVLGELFPEGLIPPGDVDALCEKVKSFIEAMPVVNPPQAFSLKTMLDKTLNLYESFIKR